MIDLLEYVVWLNHTSPVPQDSVSDTQLYVDVKTGNLIWKRSRKYTGTVLSLSDGDLIATAPEGQDVEDMEIDADGYLILTESA